MITNFILNIGIYILDTIFLLFPVGVVFPEVIHTATETLGGYLAIIEPVIPLASVGIALAFIFTVEIAIFTFKAVKALFGFIPFFGK